jgi:putative SOS response-associated peptidase YedK
MLEDDGLEVDDAPEDSGDGAPRNSYNFAPGYHGLVYLANVPNRGTRHQDGHGEAQETSARSKMNPSDGTEYRLQTMKWGLIPSWTKRNPNYGSMLKTINCRDDSLSSHGGLWSSMKARKRCIVIAQGFYEWLKIGKDKLPHYVKRKDGRLMCFAGLWDCVRYEGNRFVEVPYKHSMRANVRQVQMRRSIHIPSSLPPRARS